MATPDILESNAGAPDARTTVARASCPQPASRQLWAQMWSRIALIAGVFALVLASLLVVNTYRLARGPGNGKLRLVEARELAPLKTALREDPKNEPLKLQIRQLDQQLRQDYFRREKLARRGGWGCNHVGFGH